MSVRPWMPLWRIGTRDPWIAVKMPLRNEGNIRGNIRRFSDDRWVWMRESAWFSVRGKSAEEDIFEGDCCGRRRIEVLIGHDCFGVNRRLDQGCTRGRNWRKLHEERYN